MKYTKFRTKEKKFSVELDEIENGYEVSLYQGNDYRRIYTENLELALILITDLKNKSKGKKK